MHLEKIMASELFWQRKMSVIFLQFINIYTISPTTQNFRYEPVTSSIIYYENNNMSAFYSMFLIFIFIMLFMALVPYIS